MRNAAPVLEGFIATGVLDNLVLLDEVVAGHALVLQSHVDVHSCACLVDLRHAERDPDSLGREALGGCLVVGALADFPADSRNTGPGARKLERLGERVVLHSDVSYVGDQKRQKVATFAVLRATHHATELLRDSHDGRVRSLDPRRVSLEQHRAGCHLVRIKAHDVEDKDDLDESPPPVLILSSFESLKVGFKSAYFSSFLLSESLLSLSEVLRFELLVDESLTSESPSSTLSVDMLRFWG